MNHSIITQFQEELNYSPSQLGSHILNKSPSTHTQEIYSAKLEARIRELKASIRRNKPIIEQLKTQRRFMKKVCEKQRQKIQGTKIDLVRVEFEHEIEQLRADRHKLQDMITVIHEESAARTHEYALAKEQLHRNYLELQCALQEMQKENHMHSELLVQKNQILDLRRGAIQRLQAEISGKENIERKYKQVLEQIQQVQTSKH